MSESKRRERYHGLKRPKFIRHRSALSLCGRMSRSMGVGDPREMEVAPGLNMVDAATEQGLWGFHSEKAKGNEVHWWAAKGTPLADVVWMLAHEMHHFINDTLRKTRDEEMRSELVGWCAFVALEQALCSAGSLKP